MRFLSSLWRRWKHILQVVGNFQGRVFFSLFYFIFVTPLALALKIFGDPLGLKSRSSSYWRPIKEVEDPGAEARRQY